MATHRVCMECNTNKSLDQFDPPTVLRCVVCRPLWQQRKDAEKTAREERKRIEQETQAKVCKVCNTEKHISEFPGCWRTCRGCFNEKMALREKEAEAARIQKILAKFSFKTAEELMRERGFGDSFLGAYHRLHEKIFKAVNSNRFELRSAGAGILYLHTSNGRIFFTEKNDQWWASVTGSEWNWDSFPHVTVFCLQALSSLLDDAVDRLRLS